MSASSEIKILVSANTEQATTGFNKLVNSVTSFSGKIGAIGIGYSAVSSVVSKFVNASKECFDLFGVQEQAETKLTAALKATGNQIGVTSQEMFEMASAFQSITTYGDETVIGIEQLLISTKSLTKDGIKNATMASLNMASALGQDATTAARKLARVLEDPINNMMSLKEANIQFTTAEKDKIKALAESNKLSEAQQVILDKIESTYGGVAEAIANTDTGKLQQIKNTYGDIKEGLGHALLDTISPAIDILNKRLDETNKRVNDMLDRGKAYKAATDLLNGKADGRSVFDFSDLELQEVKINSDFEDWKTNFMAGDFNKNQKGQAPTQKDIQEALKNGYFSEVDMKAALVAESEIARRLQKAEREALLKSESENYSLEDEKLLLKKRGTKTATESIILPGINNELEAEALKKEEESKKRAEFKSSSVSSFISSNSSKSASKQIEDIQAKINEANNLRWNAEGEQKTQIEEIIAGYEKEKKALLEVKKATEEVDDEITKIDWSACATSAIDTLNSITGFMTQIWQNEIDENQAALDKMSKQWDEYYDNLKTKNNRQTESLSMMYAKGLISAEDYQAQIEKLNKAEEDALNEKNKKEEELQAKQDKLKEKQFNADKMNSLASATINGALAITSIWANSKNWVTSSILTGLVAASTAAQIATISATKYTGLATGGIVTKPTYTKLGEGEGAEAVIPLSRQKLDEYGLTQSGGQAIYITVNVQNSYSAEDLSNAVFYSVENLQRSGVLPRWRFA